MAIEKQERTHESQIGLTKQRRSSQTDNQLSFLVPQRFNSLGSPSSTDGTIIIEDDEKDEALEPKNKKTDNLDSPTFSSSGSLPSSSSDAIIIDDDGEEETLEPQNKKRRLGSWWDEDGAFNKLSCVVKGLPKLKARSKDVVSTDLHQEKTKKDDERSLSSSHHDNFIDLSDDECAGESTRASSNKGNGHVSLEELGVYGGRSQEYAMASV